MDLKLYFIQFLVVSDIKRMEEFLSRFPLAGRNIFKKLDNQDLVKCKEVSKFLNAFLEKDKSFWSRVLQKHSDNHLTFKEAWISVTKIIPVEELK